MAKYVDFMLEGETIEPGQNIQMFCVQAGTGALHYVRDCPILWRINDHKDMEEDDEKKWGIADVSYEPKTLPSTSGWNTLRFQTQQGTSLWSCEISRSSLNLYEVTIANPKTNTVQSAAMDAKGKPVGRMITLWRKETPPEPKTSGSTTTPKSGGTKATKDEAKPPKPASTGADLKWTLEAKRKAYWSMLETAYPHLKGVPDRPQTGSAAIRSEASTLLAMLQLSEEFKHAKNKKNRSSIVTAALSKAPGANEEKKLAFILPDTDGNSRSGIADATKQTAYYDWLWKEHLEKTATSIFNGFMGGKDDDPKVRVVAVGDGGKTQGVLGKSCEAIGFAPYAGRKSEQSFTLPAASGGRKTVVHVFMTGLDNDSTKPSEQAQISISVVGGSKRVFYAKKFGAQVEICPAGATMPTKILANGLKVFKASYPDGSQWNGEKAELVIPVSAFTGEKSVRIDIRAGKGDPYDEMMFGACVVGEPPPVAMFGLFKKGKQEQVPIGPSDVSGEAKEQLEQAYQELDEVARTALDMKTFEVVLAGGGCGKKSGSRIVSASEAEAESLKSLPESEMQQLRASFLETEINYATMHMKLTVRSFTDPDWGYEDNKGLSARRSWGLLGLLCKRMKTLDSGTSLAKALWNAATNDTTPPAKADYLKTPGAIKPAQL